MTTWGAACTARDRQGRIWRLLLSRVEVRPGPLDSPCFVWTGATSGNGRGGGYPRLCLDGQTVAAHRVAYTQVNGYIPGKKQLDHLCNNRLCVNPAHLELVTHKQNQRRRDQRRAFECQST